MNNIEFLQVGKIFPPIEEAKRIGNISEYNLMYDGNTHASEEKHFKDALKKSNALAILMGWETYVSEEVNYFQLTSVKTADFCCGEIPDIKATKQSETDAKRRVTNDVKQAIVDEIRRVTEFDTKNHDTWVDVSKYGEVYWRIYKREKDGKNTFTMQNPAFVFRIADETDVYETKNYVIAWITDGGTRLKAQVHGVGYYDTVEFEIRYEDILSNVIKGQSRYEISNEPNGKADLYQLIYDRYTDEIFRYSPYRIIAEVPNSRKREKTGLDDFAIIPLFNITNSTHENGTSDYDRISSFVARMQATTEKIGFMFDRYTAPTMYGDYSLQNSIGEALEVGKMYFMNPDGLVPGFLQPDIGRLEEYFKDIERDKANIKEFSEMGAALLSDTTISNVSEETMKATFVSALKKAERLTTRNENAFKKLFHLLSMVGYDEVIEEDEISITWYDGLPNSEEKDVNIAKAKIELGISSRKYEYTNRFNHTEAEFDEMWEDYLQEQADISAYSMGAASNLFGGNENGSDSDNETQETGEELPTQSVETPSEEETQ